MITPTILTVSAVVVPLLISPPIRDCQFGPMGDPATDEGALVAFERAVHDYVALHRRLERVWFVPGLEQMEGTAEQFRALLYYARPLARQGDIFTPEVAEVFRFQIVNALRERNYDIAAMTSSVGGGS